MLGHDIDHLGFERFGNNRKAGLGACLCQQFETLHAQALKCVRRCPRLECAAAQHGYARALQPVGNTDDLGFRFHRAWSGHQHDFAAANTGAVRQLDNGVFGFPFARNLLVRLAHVNDLHDAGQRFQPTAVDLAVIADQSDRGSLPARNRAGLVAHLFYGADDAADFIVGRGVTHHDEHAEIRVEEALCGNAPGSRPDGGR
ncbi:MAG TPA: hypothetical protein VK864_02085 [Longimicrobiales bacterium]|nr:hypothetical protein [Longimicrobiales bacterium]